MPRPSAETHEPSLRDIASARAEIARSDARLHVLAEASRAFASDATDYELLLRRIARTTADLVGDGCLVTLLAPDGDLMIPAATAHRDPTRESDYAEYLRALPVSKSTSHTVSARVMRSGQPELVASIDPETVRAQSDAALRPMVARLDVHSFVVVPIRAHGSILGTLSLMRSRAGDGYTPEDLAMLSDLCDRAGLALSNARLYADLERRVKLRTAELEAANAELEAFSYSVAHDLRAPLRAIDGFAHALLEDAGDRLDPPSQRHLTRIRTASQDMGRLIDDLLGLARVTRAQLTRVPVDLTVVARGIVARLHEADPTRIVETTIAEGLRADGDPTLLHVALTNLLSNAWKFTSKRPSAHIQVGHDGTAFFVRDDGVGFDARYADKLFGVFQRLHTRAEFEGTGIGLATVHRVITRHGGRVWAETGPDGGATFFFTLA